jgi:hypothetical protein
MKKSAVFGCWDLPSVVHLCDENRGYDRRIANKRPYHELEREETTPRRTLRTILQSCVASSSCWRFEIRGSITKCSLISVIRIVSQRAFDECL